MFFADGTQLQELYITPAMLTPKMWDALAEAANWSRANADVLVDTHWIGGDPNRGEVYGYASWSPRKGIVALTIQAGSRRLSHSILRGARVACPLQLPPKKSLEGRCRASGDPHSGRAAAAFRIEAVRGAGAGSDSRR